MRRGMDLIIMPSVDDDALEAVISHGRSAHVHPVGQPG